eukprot:8493436-Pyramimonas_sp.AAC.1
MGGPDPPASPPTTLSSAELCCGRQPPRPWPREQGSSPRPATSGRLPRTPRAGPLHCSKRAWPG